MSSIIINHRVSPLSAAPTNNRHNCFLRGSNYLGNSRQSCSGHRRFTYGHIGSSRAAYSAFQAHPPLVGHERLGDWAGGTAGLLEKYENSRIIMVVNPNAFLHCGIASII